MFAARQLHTDRSDTLIRADQSRGLTLATRALGIALSALLVLPIAEVAQTPQAEAGKRFKTITQTFSNTGQIAIPAMGTDGPANPYPTAIDVDAFAKYKSAQITDVNVRLEGLGHTLSQNIDVMLVHDSVSTLVMADAGNGTDVADLTITLDDEASVNLPQGAVLTSGSFQPANYVGADVFPAPAPAVPATTALTVFDGLDPDGAWQLYIVDDATLETGHITGGWELEITAKVKQEKHKKKKGGHGNGKKHGKKD
jgi:hypothetical protein